MKWLNEGPLRAERCIQEARTHHDLGLGALYSALGEFGDDPPDESDARRLARVVGCLRPDEYRYLLHLVLTQLHSGSKSAVYGAEHELDERLLSLGGRSDAPDPNSVAIADIRGNASGGWADTPRTALILQALVWSVKLPSEDEPMLAY